MSTPNKNENITADKTGIASAVLCTIHCLAVPVFFIIKTNLADNYKSMQLPHWWHQLDYLFLLISFWAVYHSASHTLYRKVKASLWGFWALLAIALLFEGTLAGLAYAASAGLIITHFINIRMQRRRKRTTVS